MSDSTQSESQSPVTRLKALLRRVLRITISDGRIFLGTFAGTDQPLNILLINAEEYRLGTEEHPDGRYIGQIVIPWKLVLKVEAELQRDDAASRQSLYL